ncbi:ABC transporter permease [Paenibacillus tengchongensis]|uniref:ABC transporter permease n=1 Tax=Paenibacillus tengchongensis TaxID=2608684 RepID=UPI00124F13F1|nr:ABC transporter permease [Paenibacillus tengchongensis]
MYNLIRAELFKLRKNGAFWTLLSTLFLLSLAYPLLNYFDHKSNGEPQMTGAEFFITFTASNAHVIKFGVAILAGFFICTEYSSGVMKTIASSGNTRWRLFTAKLIVFAAGAMAASLVFPVVGTAEVTLLSGFGHLPEGSAASLIPRALGLTLLYSAAFAAMGAMFAVLLTDSDKTVSVLLVFFMLMDTLWIALGTKIAIVADLHDYSIFKLSVEIGKPVIDSGDWPALVLVPLLTMALSAVLGILAFRRKEIK